MTKDDFLEARELGLTFRQIGEVFDLTERQVGYRVKQWGLDFSKKKSLNHSFFSSGTNEAYYWAGFLAADGWIEGDRNRVGLALKADDKQHLEKFKKAIGSAHEICSFMNSMAYRIRFDSAEMCSDLLNIFNITPAKTHTYSMPNISNDVLLIEYLRGYIEGDGNLNKTASGRVCLSLCSAREEFLEQYRTCCERLLNTDIPQEIYLNKNSKGSVYSLRFNLDTSREMIRLLYKNSTDSTRLDRKFAIASLVL